MQDKAMGLLGIMRKASALAIGEENTVDALKKGKVKLLILPSDASEKRKKDAELLLRGRNAESVEVPYTGQEIADALGIGGCSILAITDLGFASSFIANLPDTGQKYEEISEALKRRLEKAKRRKRETALNGKKNQRGGE